MVKQAFLFFFLLMIIKSRGQHNYPKNYFGNPLGIPMQLSANFGELRTNHFHMGLDLRTNQKENLKVYAAADGYISKIKIEQYGYGQAIYITHPNGYVTLYAHLNRFYDTLSNFIKAKQYAEKQWEQEFELQPNQFTVSKGQQIGLSGNTGGSQGPHLHFEIRDAKTGNNLNPLFFYNIKDNIKPVVSGVYLYNRNYSTYTATPKRLNIKGSKGFYTTKDSVIITGANKLSFGITATDKDNVSPFSYGIYSAVVVVDSVKQFEFKLNDFSYDQSKAINACIDYTKKYKGGPYVQHVSRLPNNNLLIFNKDLSNDIIELKDTLPHTVSILVMDIYGNESKVNFIVKYDAVLEDNMMGIQNYLPFKAAVEHDVIQDDIQAQFSMNAFYDDVDFVYGKTESNSPLIASPVHQLHNYLVPVHDSFFVSIKPNAGHLAKKEKIIMQLAAGNRTETLKPLWNNGFATGKLSRLGKAYLLVDEAAPVISPVGFTNNSTITSNKIVVKVTDNSEEIKIFTALLDSSWIMCSRKDDYYIYEIDERCTLGKHELIIIAEDLVGNITERSYTFTKANKKSVQTKKRRRR